MNDNFNKTKYLSEIVLRFNIWIKLKIKLHLSRRVIYFYERQLWWASLGQNVGSEQNGKNINFERPVLILKKFNKDTFIGIPISTKIKMSKYHFNFLRNGKRYSINLSQIRTFSSKRLLRLIGKISRLDFDSVNKIFREI